MSNLYERNDETINNIKKLQNEELSYYKDLDNVNLSMQQKQDIINKINNVSQMRTNLYASLKDIYSSYNSNVASSRNTLGEQLLALDIIENELNEARRRLNLLEIEKYNKLRGVQINTYYGKRYNAHKNIMKTIFLICLPILIIAILNSKGILPNNLAGLLIGIILIIGTLMLIYQLVDLVNRDNMNFDEYNWYFDKSKAPTSNETSEVTDPWATPSVVCVGQQCCSEGMTYDSNLNVCVPNDTNLEESFVNYQLTKQSKLPIKYT